MREKDREGGRERGTHTNYGNDQYLARHFIRFRATIVQSCSAIARLAVISMSIINYSVANAIRFGNVSPLSAR